MVALVQRRAAIAQIDALAQKALQAAEYLLHNGTSR
jgi:hypothetical protein